MAHRTIQVKDLPTNPLVFGHAAFLYCVKCGAEVSANPADYFFSDPDFVFECCGLPMSLMTKHVVYSEVPLP